ncbi:general transcription factor II-I repeat domain-containing protein 2A-like [Schistocerca piceifrons]|uniref:general transcription factor II-I repeat domain-containing protein 2A-like n=1 Tax=Schistocerca piceifrons TaxID=274613 RepID=UPI001F5F0C6A|nr:general transcription factor II-I repeat domain-containing protein 2A-like [Schistocerca piceifrons]
MVKDSMCCNRYLEWKSALHFNDNKEAKNKSDTNLESHSQRLWYNIIREFQENLAADEMIDDRPLGLACHKVFNSAKRYNIRRHYTRLHPAHYDQVEGLARREPVARLKNDIPGDVNETGENTTESEIRASYRVAHIIATSGKLFSMGSLVKSCMVAVAEYLFPSEVQAIEGVCLSKQTMSRPILDMAADLETQLSKKTESFVAVSLAHDKSTDISDCVQLAVFVRDVDMELQVSEEFLEVLPLDYIATGRDIFEAVCESVDNMNLLWDKLHSVATDRAPQMIGRHQGFASRLKNKLRDEFGKDILTLECFIHQEALCAETVELGGVMKNVVK